MVNMSAKDKILQAAIDDFSRFGFEGARVDRIAEKADINKAMIFYYFSSKRKLYQSIITNAFKRLLPEIRASIEKSESPERFLELLPEVYIRFLHENPYIVRLILPELMYRPDNITRILKDMFRNLPEPPQKTVLDMIRGWSEKGLIREPDPVQFIMNIISLSIFTFIGSPMVEAVLGVSIALDEAFIKQRIESVTHVLKGGMLA
jgi:TetR/AcrR family transcriptional regulator